MTRRKAKGWLESAKPQLLIRGDCVKVMSRLPENFVDSIVTDPPYEIGLIGKSWDNRGVSFSKETWSQALRVAKPGAYLLAFGSSRTYHRIACAIEDAGWEIRDSFLNLISSDTYFTQLVNSLNKKQRVVLLEFLNSLGLSGYLSWIYATGYPKSLDVSKAIDKKFGEKRKDIPYMGQCPYLKRGQRCLCGERTEIYQKWPEIHILKTAPVSDLAKQYKGFGTGLKPSFEPIIIARKPLEGYVVNNLLKYGTGAMNISACLVKPSKRLGSVPYTEGRKKTPGRWPANVLCDGSEEVISKFPIIRDRGSSRNQKGSAARFFYCPKVSNKERNEGCKLLPRKTSGNRNTHLTLKPIALMRYLIKLVTRRGGVVFDPFMGSGSTGVAALKKRRWRFIGVEHEQEYMDIAKERISHALTYHK